MQRQRRRDTSAELALRSLLHRRGFRFRVEYAIPGTRRRIDIAFPLLTITVLVLIAIALVEHRELRG